MAPDPVPLTVFEAIGAQNLQAAERVCLDGSQIRAFTQAGLEVYFSKCGFGTEEAKGIAGDVRVAKEKEASKVKTPPKESRCSFGLVQVDRKTSKAE